jgi:hypothetical protein
MLPLFSLLVELVLWLPESDFRRDSRSDFHGVLHPISFLSFDLVYAGWHLFHLTLEVDPFDHDAVSA